MGTPSRACKGPNKLDGVGKLLYSYNFTVSNPEDVGELSNDLSSRLACPRPISPQADDGIARVQDLLQQNVPLREVFHQRRENSAEDGIVPDSSTSMWEAFSKVPFNGGMCERLVSRTVAGFKGCIHPPDDLDIYGQSYSSENETISPSASINVTS
jgi:hypothetical protein